MNERLYFASSDAMAVNAGDDTARAGTDIGKSESSMPMEWL